MSLDDRQGEGFPRRPFRVSNPKPFGGDIKLIMARLVDSSKFTLDDVKDVEEMLREHRSKEKSK